jgi:hypothetical protein
VAAPRGVGEQVSINGFPDFIRYMQADGLGQVIPHPPAGLNMGFRRSLNAVASQP